MPLRAFLTNLSEVAAREPHIFAEAVMAVCDMDEQGGRTLIFLKDPKSGETPKAGGAPTGETPGAPGAAPAPTGTPAPAAAAAQTPAAASRRSVEQATPGPSHAKQPAETPGREVGGKSVGKTVKKIVPASFVEVIDCLVDILLKYKGSKPAKKPAGGE